MDIIQGNTLMNCSECGKESYQLLEIGNTDYNDLKDREVVWICKDCIKLIREFTNI